MYTIIRGRQRPESTARVAFLQSVAATRPLEIAFSECRQWVHLVYSPRLGLRTFFEHARCYLTNYAALERVGGSQLCGNERTQDSSVLQFLF